MKAICKNCRYIGAIESKDDLVCSQTKNFDSVNLDDTCDKYIQDICERCGSENIDFNSFSPEEKPYVIRTEYRCQTCDSFWYIDI